MTTQTAGSPEPFTEARQRGLGQHGGQRAAQAEAGLLSIPGQSLPSARSDPQPTPGDHACGPVSLGWDRPRAGPLPPEPWPGSRGLREGASPGDWHWPLPRWASWTQEGKVLTLGSPQGDKSPRPQPHPCPSRTQHSGELGVDGRGGPPSQGPGLLPQPWGSSRQHPGPGPGGVTASGCRILTPTHERPSQGTHPFPQEPRTFRKTVIARHKILLLISSLWSN